MALITFGDKSASFASKETLAKLDIKPNTGANIGFGIGMALDCPLAMAYLGSHEQQNIEEEIGNIKNAGGVSNYLHKKLCVKA